MVSTDPHIAFWQWYSDNIDRFNHLEDEQERLMDELSDQLHLIDENLTFEISSSESNRRELIISADGIKESFPSVVELVGAAPEIPGWTITAFRPRIDVTQFRLGLDGREFAAKEFYFGLQSEDQQIDLILYIPELTEDNHDDFVNICYLLLDMAIGEYDVTTKIRYIDHQPLPPNPETEGLKPLTELPREFDDMHTHLQANQ